MPKSKQKYTRRHHKQTR